MRTAQAFAQLLMCTSEAGEAACGTCVGCERVVRFTHPDLHIVLPARRGGEADQQKALEEYGRNSYHCLQVPPSASIGIERIRSLKAESAKARVETGSRVIIIRGAERMTLEAAQAALKLIEEPQAGTYLVLTCRDSVQLLPTILSRCQRLRFRPLPRVFVEQVLKEELGCAEAQARMIAGLARGSVGRGIAMCSEDVLALRQHAIELFEVPARDPADVGRRVQSLGGAWNAEAARRLVDFLMTWYEDLLSVRVGLATEAITNADRLEALGERAGRISVAEIKRRIGILEEMIEAVEHNVNPALALQAALLRVNRLVAEDALF
jgi:DNA polymerase-3 subunit delta'